MTGATRETCKFLHNGAGLPPSYAGEAGDGGSELVEVTATCKSVMAAFVGSVQECVSEGI